MIPPDSFKKRILIDLFTDFQSKAVTHKDLIKGYEGISISELEKNLVGGSSEKVSYDIAFDDLMKEKLIWTGPRVFFNKRLADDRSFIGTEDKKEYVCITETGLKYYFNKFKEVKSKARESSTVSINHSNFYNSPVGIGENIYQTISISEEGEILVKELLGLLKKEKGEITSDEEKEIRLVVQDIESEEKSSRIKERFLGVFNFAKEGTVAVAWNLVAAAISGRLNL